MIRKGFVEFTEGPEMFDGPGELKEEPGGLSARPFAETVYLHAVPSHLLDIFSLRQANIAQPQSHRASHRCDGTCFLAGQTHCHACLHGLCWALPSVGCRQRTLLPASLRNLAI